MVDRIFYKRTDAHLHTVALFVKISSKVETNLRSNQLTSYAKPDGRTYGRRMVGYRMGSNGLGHKSFCRFRQRTRNILSIMYKYRADNCNNIPRYKKEINTGYYDIYPEDDIAQL